MSRLSISVLTLTLAVVLTTSPLTHAATATQVESGVLNYVAHALNTVGEILLSIRDRLAGTFIPNDTLPAQVITGARILKETPEALTLKLLTLKKTYDTSSNKEVRANVHSQLIAVSKKRLNALSALVEENPQEALRLMLPATELQTLPLETRAFFEEEVTLEGTLEVRHTDDFENGIATYVYNLKLNTGKSLTLRPTDGIINQNGGRTVRVRGTKIGDTVLIDSTHTQSVQNLSTSETSSGTNAPIAFVPPQNTFGEQKTLVFLMTYKDQPNNQPFTVDFVRNMVFGPGKSVSNYFKEASYGQTWLTGDVVGWYPS